MGLRRIRGNRTARVAVVRCPVAAGPCRIWVQRWVAVRVGGRRCLAHVMVRRRIPAGGRRMVRLRLPKVAASRLRGRRKAVVRFRLAVVQRDGFTTRTTVRVKLKRPRSATQRRAGTPNRQRLRARKGQ